VNPQVPNENEKGGVEYERYNTDGKPAQPWVQDHRRERERKKVFLHPTT
jgi:hypothetical protein